MKTFPRGRQKSCANSKWQLSRKIANRMLAGYVSRRGNNVQWEVLQLSMSLSARLQFRVNCLNYNRESMKIISSSPASSLRKLYASNLRNFYKAKDRSGNCQFGFRSRSAQLWRPTASVCVYNCDGKVSRIVFAFQITKRAYTFWARLIAAVSGWSGLGLWLFSREPRLRNTSIKSMAIALLGLIRQDCETC